MTSSPDPIEAAARQEWRVEVPELWPIANSAPTFFANSLSNLIVKGSLSE